MAHGLFHGHAHGHQGFGGDQQAAFQHFGNDLAGPHGLESGHVLVIAGAHHDGQAGAARMGQADDALGRVDVGVAHHQGAGTAQAGGLQHLGAVGAAKHHVGAFLLGGTDALRVGVQGDEGDGFALQQVGNALAGAPIAADDHMLFEVHAVHGHVLDDGGAVGPVAAPEIHRQAGGLADQEGRHEHGDEHGRERDLEHVERDQLQRMGQLHQHQPELAGLRQLRGGAQRGHQRGLGQRGQQQHDQALADDEQQHRQRQLVQVGQHEVQVQHHADGDEEQAQQDVAERPDVGLHLVAVDGLRDQHAADESPQRHRQPAQGGGVGQGHHHPQRDQHQQLVGAVLRKARKHPPQVALAQPDQHCQHGHGLHARQGQRREQAFARRRQRGQQDQARHHRQVLEQQHAHGLASAA